MEDTRELTALPAIQRPLWLASRMTQDLPVYNEAEGFRLTGPLDRSALVGALDALYSRHPALRSTVVPDEDGLPYVRILPEGPFPLEELDLRGHPPEEARELGERAATDAVRRTFDLSTGPLVRAYLIRRADEEWLFGLVLHHLVSDGDSFQVLFGELGALYAGAALPEPAEDPVAAQRLLETVAGEARVRADLDYWRGQLAGLPDQVTVPAGGPAAEHAAHLGRRQPLALREDWFATVRETAARLRASPFAVVAAAVSVVMSRFTRTDDLVIGSTVNMRSEVDAEELVGYFMKVVPLRLRVEETGTAAELVRTAHETVLDAMDHTAVGFDEIVAALDRRGAGHSPVFRVALELHYESSGLTLPGIAGTRLSIDPGTSKFDVTFHLNATPGTPSYLEHRIDLYDGPTAEGLSGAVAALLERLCAAPDGPVEELPLDDGRGEGPWRHWQTGPDLVRAFVPLPDAVRERAALHPDRPAVVCGAEVVDYAEFVRRADLLGGALAGAGVEPGDVVGVSVRRSAAQISALFGVWSAGAVCAPLDPGLPAERLGRMMDAAGIRVVLVDDGTDASPAFADVCRVPTARSSDPSDPAGPVRPPGPEVTAPVGKVTAEDVAYLIFTSGTSGTPKPVAVRHLSLTAFGEAMGRLAFDALPRAARVAVNAPFSFDASWQGTQLLRRGHTVFPVPDAVRADPEAMVGFLREHAIDALDGTPTHLASLVDAGLLERGAHVPGVLVLGGEAVSAELWGRLASGGTRAFNVYGPTEFTVNATACAIEDPGARPVIGRPLAGVTARVLDSRLRPVPVGFPGELHLSGPQLAVGYVGRPELTARCFLRAPDGSRQYATGDVVRWRGDGNLEFLGRRDDQVKLRGYRIEPAEITAALRAAPGVADAAVVVIGHGTPTAVLHACLVTAGDPLDAGPVRAFAATRLPGYMVPSSYSVVSQLPRTATGKVDTAAIAMAVRPAGAPARPGVSSPVRRRLARIWSRLLDLEDVADEDDFFALGGHSLLAGRLVRQVGAEFGVRLALRTVFGCRTLAAMADALEAEMASGSADGVTDGGLVVALAGGSEGEPADGRAPLVVLHPLGGSLFAYEPLLRLLPASLAVWGVRSPSAAGAGEEPPDVASLAARYADDIVARVPAPRLALFGWSLGGLIALAVAAELEARGVEIEFVEMWDCGVGTEEPLGDRESLRMALRAAYGPEALRDHGPLVDGVLDGVAEGERLDDVALKALADRTLPMGTASDAAALPGHFEVIRQQTELFRGWEPVPVHAPLHAVYAEPSLRDGSVARTDWRRFTRAPWTESTVGAGHYAMMRPPAVAESARELLGRLAGAVRDEPAGGERVSR